MTPIVAGRDATAVLRALAQDQATVEIFQRYECVGIRCLVIKGRATSALLGVEGLRMSADIDLLVPRSQYRSAQEILGELGYVDAMAGYKPHERFSFESGWVRGPVNVDLHQSLADLPDTNAVERVFFELPETLDIGGTRVWCPRVAVRLCHVVLHHAQSSRQRTAFRTAGDLLAAMEALPMQMFAEARDVAEDLDALDLFAAALIHVAAHEHLQALSLSQTPVNQRAWVVVAGAPRGRDTIARFARLPWRQRPEELVRLLRPSRHSLATRDPGAVDNRRAAARAYGHRLFDGLVGLVDVARRPGSGRTRVGQSASRPLRLFAFVRLMSAWGLEALRPPHPIEQDRRTRATFVMPPAQASRYLEDGPAGLSDPSRSWLRDSVVKSQPSGLVLDAGCGPGHDLAALSGRIRGQLVGCDAAAEMLDAALTRASELSLLRADMSRLPFPDGTFDVVYSRHTLEFVDDPVAVVRELCRVSSDRVVLGCFAVRRKRQALTFGSATAGSSVALAALEAGFHAMPDWSVTGMRLENGRYGILAERGLGGQAWEEPERDARWTYRDQGWRMITCALRLMVARTALRGLPVARVARLLPASRAWEPLEAEQLVRQVAACLPWRPACLEQSIVLAQLLAPADLVLATSREDVGWAMHAWVEVGGLRLEPVQDARTFGELARYRVGRQKPCR